MFISFSSHAARHCQIPFKYIILKYFVFAGNHSIHFTESARDRVKVLCESVMKYVTNGFFRQVFLKCRAEANYFSWSRGVTFKIRKHKMRRRTLSL